MKNRTVYISILSALFFQCGTGQRQADMQREISDLNLSRGEIALCGSGEFGTVDFGLSCAVQVQADFNLATALLHSFEYAEAEKVFARVIDADPQCLMAYWGVAMSNFHPLWSPPTPDELKKGSAAIALARKLEAPSPREQKYIDAIATIFDEWDKLDHKTRIRKFEEAAKVIYEQYPDDTEAAIFYALALRASSDPADKSFAKQKQAGEILSKAFTDKPDHPGIAHYLIHTYDYPELAELGLPAARKYAAIASTSAHAQHMPSHIFTRLGLWDEAVQSNLRSMDAAKCYAEKLGKDGHWDQELHGLDYVVYAYLQQANDNHAKEQIDYLNSIDKVFPLTFVNAYTFAVAPMRYALERNDWEKAASLELRPADFPWDKFLWQKSIFHFGKLLGYVNTKRLKEAGSELEEMKAIYALLDKNTQAYEANQVAIQIKAGEGWLRYFEGNQKEAMDLMIAAAEMEDATEKHSVTPGEVAPARELLGNLYFATGNYPKAIEAYQANLRKRPGRFKSIYGIAESARRSGDHVLAKDYFEKLIRLTESSQNDRREVQEAKAFMRGV